MARRGLVGFVVALAACNPVETTEAEVSEDLQIDGDDAAAVNSVGTRMCVSEAGHVYVVWLDDREVPDRTGLWMNRAVSDPSVAASWLETPVRVNHGSGNVWNPDLHCDDEGLVVVWEDDRDGEFDNHQIYANRWLEERSAFLEDDVLVETDDEGSTMSLKPRIAGDGLELMVAWMDSGNGAYDILVNRSGDGGESWSTPQRLDSGLPGAAYSANPEVAMHRSDRIVVWEDSRDGGSDLYTARSASSGVTYLQDRRINGGEAGINTASAHQVCVSGTSVSVVWRDTRAPDGIWFNHSIDGGQTWLDDATRVQPDDVFGTIALSPSCVADGATTHLFWMDGRNGASDVRYRQARGGFLDANELVANLPASPSNARQPVSSLDPLTGSVAVAWVDDRAVPTDGTSGGAIYYQYFDNGVVAGAGDRDYRVDAMFEQVAQPADLQFEIRNNQWFAAWTDGRGTTADVRFHSGVLGTASTPPSPQQLRQ